MALSEHMLRVLPDLEIAAIGAALEPGVRLALDAYAVRVSDLVWQLEATKLLAATEEGRSVGEIREFLAARSLGRRVKAKTARDAGDQTAVAAARSATYSGGGFPGSGRRV